MRRAQLIIDDQNDLFLVPKKLVKKYHQEKSELNDTDFSDKWQKYCINDNPDMHIFIK